MNKTLAATCALLAAFAVPAWGQEAPPALDSGTTAWMLTAAVLGLMMTVPGIAMFYGGMVRRKNMLSISGQCFGICCLVSVLWILVGYSLAFSGDNEYIGDLGMLFLANLDLDSLRGSFPESLYVVFQLGFGVVAAALITGAVADRMKFSALLFFIGLWSIVVYAPVVHWIWGGGFLKEQGVLDYAGGTIVHINAGVAGLVACLVVGKRTGYGAENMAPHNPLFSVIGVSLLWIGWFGFSAGSSLTAGGNAAYAMLVTQTSAAAGALTWMFYEWAVLKKPSVLGLVSGAVAGLVAITPAAGYVSPVGALAIGVVAGFTCCWACAWLKYSLGYDDALDVFGIHGIGGLLGAVLTGVFALEEIGNAAGAVDGNFWQIWVQFEGVLAVSGWSALGTVGILYLLKRFIGLRVSVEEEAEGLDYSQHGEAIGADM
ncbi:MAG: ammonium transporter [Gammaproteobacteria bacterium]|nr:ammonium transporter [Gammaproteobacteria bacterium]MXY55027.1 ammonium transporter [Gammaproteobacteria bacterium]MYF30349.1 ammonium transporter [Gammaproteobacteria bacterium]MYK46725.1 ammonium transporter [Gammaproteobacteria bacterium]